MRYQDTGERVRDVQVALGDAGHDPGPTDGVLGDRTWSALKGYCKERVLGWAPVVPQATLDSLMGPAARPPPGGTVPDGATFEADLGNGVALYDVSAMLPRHESKVYSTREPGGIVRAYAHHSGALGADGYAGMANSAQYAIDHRGWPGMPYTAWLPYVPDIDADGRLVIYRGQKDVVRSYHTGGEANAHGVGYALQGDLSVTAPSIAQHRLFHAFVLWLARSYALSGDNGLSFHSESAQYGGSGKSSCPGPHVEALVKEARG